jgi:UDP-N-acetyl-D-mannosaminuronate dehydrogenase
MHDPYVGKETLKEVLEGTEVIFIAVNHTEYQNLKLDDLKRYSKEGCIVVDIWNVLKKKMIFQI